MATKADVEKLALTDPIVRAHVDAQRYGRGISWDEMMCALVVSLVEAKGAEIALALDHANRSLPRYILDCVASDSCKVSLPTLPPNKQIQRAP